MGNDRLACFWVNSADCRNLSNLHGATRVNIKITAVSHKKALILALLGIVGGLVISVTSFAATSSSSTVTIGAGGSSEFGYTVSQTTTGSAAVLGADTTSITLSDATSFSVGDKILIENDANGDPSNGLRAFFTITAQSGDNNEFITVLNDETASTDPTASGVVATDNVFEPSVYDSTSAASGVGGIVTDLGSGATWTPALNSSTSVTPGNNFLVNLKGLTSSDSAFVEILNTNPNELVKNYTYLNRTFGVYVYCDSSSSCSDSSNADPYTSGSVNAGSWDAASDVSGETINAVGDLLTLQNARVQFNLIGDYVYAITMDGGALFTIDTTTGTGDSLSPTDQIGITAR